MRGFQENYPHYINHTKSLQYEKLNINHLTRVGLIAQKFAATLNVSYCENNKYHLSRLEINKYLTKNNINFNQNQKQYHSIIFIHTDTELNFVVKKLKKSL